MITKTLSFRTPSTTPLIRTFAGLIEGSNYLSKKEKLESNQMENFKTYEKYRKIKKVDFRAKDISFPLKVKFAYRTRLHNKPFHLMPRPDITGKIKFASLTGNGILLAMLDAPNFSTEELS